MNSRFVVKDSISGAVVLRDFDGLLVDARDAENPLEVAFFDNEEAHVVCMTFRVNGDGLSRWEVEPAGKALLDAALKVAA